MLLLSNDDVQQVLKMSDCLTVLRGFFEKDASGGVVSMVAGSTISINYKL